MADKSGYGGRPMWQWILIYVVVGGIIYFLIYYFVLAKNGGYNSGSMDYGTATPSSQQSPTGTSTDLPSY
ncbi:MAG: hypothetical protein Q7R49_05295 [Candidatus Daviesbacteria bacterium]|nr:hypothetical protein [Candidatus Daviesbacteria bacterium]